MEFSIPKIEFSIISPEIAIFVTAVTVLLMGLKSNLREYIPHVCIVGLLIAFYFSVGLWMHNSVAFNGMIVSDKFSVISNMIFLVSAFLIIMLSYHFVQDTGREGEYYFLIFVSVLGMMILGSSRNLIMVFLGIETMSIPLYLLTGFRKYNERSLEAALKYLLLGAFSAAFLLFGISLIYGAAGSVDFKDIIKYINTNEFEPGLLIYVGIGLTTIGLGFKVALVPFHMWVPDVYEGAPTPVTAFMAAAVKAAGFTAVIRFFIYCLGSIHIDWLWVLWVLSVLTMTVGNVIALIQSNIKRLLAYSSIAHAGYILVALTSGSFGTSPALYYLVVYLFMTIGAFSVLVFLTKENKELLEIDDYAGLGFKKPLLSAAMVVFMFSLAGIPPTAGFFGKLYIFRAAMQADLLWLTIIAVINAVMAVYYYLKVIIVMYMREPEIDFSVIEMKPVISIALIITTGSIIILGVYPGIILNFFNNFVGF